MLHDAHFTDITFVGLVFILISCEFQGLLDLAILDDGNIAVGDGPAQALFLVHSTTGEATEVIQGIASASAVELFRIRIDPSG